MSDVARLKAEWQSLRDEEHRLSQEADRLAEQQRKVAGRLRELRGSAWESGGLIRIALAAWKQADATERDKRLPRVIWKRDPKFGEKELVLVKATPKRLFVRGIGWPHCSQYDRSTGMRAGRADTGHGGIIDVAKTLGDRA